MSHIKQASVSIRSDEWKRLIMQFVISNTLTCGDPASSRVLTTSANERKSNPRWLIVYREYTRVFHKFTQCNELIELNVTYVSENTKTILKVVLTPTASRTTSMAYSREKDMPL